MHAFIKKTISKTYDLLDTNITGAITRVLTNDPVACLTFDDGPDPIYTPKVLDILKNFDAKATFFMVGESAQKYPNLVKLVANDGHAIGNHSWNHHAFNLITSAERLIQISKCQKTIEYHGQKIFRAPYGMSNHKANINIFLMGYKLIGWSLESEDWFQTNEKVIAENLLENIEPGSIVLLHDCVYDRGKPINGPTLCRNAVVERDTMLSALEVLLRKLKGKLKFVTIPFLLKNGRAIRDRW
jgi:peptidoglycan-N-acetylglucosamine deacetylase